MHVQLNDASTSGSELAEARIRNLGHDSAEIGVVHSAEHVQADLETSSLAESEVFRKREIQIPRARRAHRASTDVTGTYGGVRCGAEWHARECRLVQILEGAAIIAHYRIPADIVRAAILNR